MSAAWLVRFLVPAVVDAVAPIPVVAAGGIADGRGIAAAFVLGASAAWLGTRFVASEEALADHTYKQKLLAAGVGDTIYSTLFDVGWENAAHRALRNSTVEMWEKAGRPPRGERPNEGQVIARKADVLLLSAIALVRRWRRCMVMLKVWCIMPVKAWG